VHRDDFDRCLQVYKSHFEARKEFRMQYRLRRHDGAYRWVDDIGIPRYAGAGAFLGYIGSCTDISDLKDAEASIRESEVRLRLALEAAQMGTFEADLAGTEAIIDAQEARLLGLPDGTRAVSIEKMRTYISVDDLEASDLKQERLTKEGEPYQHEFRFRMPDGSERWLNGRADIRGNRIFGVNFDVTERKLAEAQLRESEERLRIATNAASLGVFERDLNSDRANWLNDRMYAIFERSRAEGPLTNKVFVKDYLHRDDVKEFVRARQRALAGDGELHLICRIRLPNGVQRWIRIEGKYEFTEGREPWRLVGVVADITQQKVLEQEATELSERLIKLQEDERQRIAHELHDSTMQHLVAVSLNLMGLRPADGLSKEENRRWDETEGCLHEAMKEIRTFSYLMHPPALAAAGLNSTIREYVAGFSDRSKLAVQVRLSWRLDRLSIEKKRTLLRIIQEALANVHRHAAASFVRVDGRYIGNRVHLIIDDDGRGYQDNEAARLGGGVRGMQARTERWGGQLRIRAKMKGTRVHAVLPARTQPGRRRGP
jgi:PAS domain S-box-containing protein